MRFLFQISIVALTSLIAGCATILNIEGEKEVYGGVKVAPSMVADGLATHEPNLNLGIGCMLLFDLPLTLVGDTLTLPITIPAAYRRFMTDFDTFARQSDQAPPPQQKEDSSLINPPHLQRPVETVPDQSETELVLPALSATKPGGLTK